MEIICILCKKVPLNENKDVGHFFSGDDGFVCYYCFNKTPARRMSATNNEELEKAIAYAVKYTRSKQK